MWSLYYNFWRDIPWPAAATLIPACFAGAVASATSLCFAAMAVYNSEEVVFKSDEDDSSPVSNEEDETSNCTLAEDSPDNDELYTNNNAKEAAIGYSGICYFRCKHFKGLLLKTKLDSILSKSLSKKQCTPTMKKAGAGVSRKMLDMDAPLLSEGSFETKINSVLGRISNMLETVIEHLDKTESKIECLQHSFKSLSSSTGTSGSERCRKVPTVVRVSVFIIIIIIIIITLNIETLL